MFLNKIKLFLLISICLIFFFLTYNDVKSNELKIIDGDTIHLNGEKIRFSGIDTPEIKQTCIKNNEIIKCGIKAKELLIKVIGNKKINCVREGKDQYKRTLAECFVNDLSLWYVINVRGGDYEDIFYTIMATNWAMGIVVLIFIGYFLNNVFKQKKPLFSY